MRSVKYSIHPYHINHLRYFIVSRANCLQVSIAPKKKSSHTTRKSSIQLEKPVYSSRKILRSLQVKGCSSSFESFEPLINEDNVRNNSVLEDSTDLDQIDFKEDFDIELSPFESAQQTTLDSSKNDLDSENSSMSKHQQVHEIKDMSEKVKPVILAPGTLAAKFDKMTDTMKNFYDSDGSVDSGKEDEQEGQYRETDKRTQLFFMESFERNKTYVRDLVKCLTNIHEKSKICSERLLALSMLPEREFRSCADDEIYVFQQQHGPETLDTYREHVLEIFQSDCESKQLGTKGKWLIDIKPRFNFGLSEFYTKVILHELITKACAEYYKCSYRNATRRMFKESPYHFPLLKLVSLCLCTLDPI